MAAQTEIVKMAPPPYLPYKTLLTFLATLKVGIPARIDRSLISNFSGSTQAWLMAALRYLNLIHEDGRPKDSLALLVNSEGQERQRILLQLLTHAYPLLFHDGFNLKTITGSQLEEEFRKYKLAPATTERCIAFFTAAAKDAGIELSPHLKKQKAKPRPRQANGTPKAKVGKRVPETAKNPETKHDHKPVTPDGFSRMPITLGPDKVWYVEVERSHTPEDAQLFVRLAGIILGAEPKK